MLFGNDEYKKYWFLEFNVFVSNENDELSPRETALIFFYSLKYFCINLTKTSSNLV